MTIGTPFPTRDFRIAVADLVGTAGGGGTVGITAGAITFSLTQATFITANTSVIIIGGVAYPILTFNGTTGATTLASVTGIAGSAFTLATLVEVGGMESWDGDVNEQVTEVEVFHVEDSLQIVDKEKGTFQLQGKLLTATDSGQNLINTKIPLRQFFLMQVLWDGTNGFQVQVRVASRKRSTKAGPNLADTNWNFIIKPSTITIIGAGPAF